MVIGVILIILAIFFYLLLRGASTQRDWAQEDKEQAEYLRQYRLRQEQRKKKNQTG